MREISIKEVDRIYEELNKCKNKVVIIGICGESASGKSYFCDMLKKKLNATVISMDDYYFDEKDRISNNFDDPKNHNLNLIREHLFELKKGNKIMKPIYDFETSSPVDEEEVKPAKFIILEGLWSLDKRFLDLYDLSIFVEASRDVRYKRRVKRDLEIRKMKMKLVLQYWNDAERMAKIHVVPTKKNADYVVIND